MTENEVTAEITEDGDVENAGHYMDAEVAVSYDARTQGGPYGYLEVGVGEGDNIADVYVEDGDNAEPVRLRLNADELRDLIASLERARDTVEANS